MAEFVKCRCANCGAKYRLPIEFQGRMARCKKCGEKFAVPKKDKTLEDSVLDWLNEGEREEEEVVAQPRVISIPKESSVNEQGGAASSKRRGPIRMKSATPSEE